MALGRLTIKLEGDGEDSMLGLLTLKLDGGGPGAVESGISS